MPQYTTPIKELQFWECFHKFLGGFELIGQNNYPVDPARSYRKLAGASLLSL